MGICLPLALSGHSGYLTRRQQHLQSLCLVIDGSCPTADYPLGLSQFTRLKSLSWKGLGSIKDFRALGGSLKANALCLEDLNIEVTSWSEPDDTWLSWKDGLSSNSLATEILQLNCGDSNGLLPSLQRLSLSSLSFELMTLEVIHAFNFSALCRLKLWNCNKSTELLKGMIVLENAIMLTSFELVHAHESHLLDALSLANFLKKFQGLRDLYLLIPGPADWASIGHGILNHKSTLRRLVVHECTLGLRDGYDTGIVWDTELESIAVQWNLRCFGMSINVDGLVRTISFC